MGNPSDKWLNVRHSCIQRPILAVELLKQVLPIVLCATGLLLRPKSFSETERCSDQATDNLQDMRLSALLLPLGLRSRALLLANGL